MSLVLARSIALSATALFDARLPIILWDSQASSANVAADQEDASYPASNLFVPDTDLVWKSGSLSAQSITATGLFEDFEGIGIQGHNWGSGQTSAAIYTLDPAPGSPWVLQIPAAIPGDDGVLLYRVPKGTYAGWRIDLVPGTIAPQAAVLMAGPLLVLVRGIPLGHIPISMGETSETVNPRAQSGSFLGRIILNSTRQTTIAQQNVEGDWYLDNVEPFRQHCKEGTFFFWWSPLDHPTQGGYCWTVNDPQPTIVNPLGWVSINFQIEGVAS